MSVVQGKTATYCGLFFFSVALMWATGTAHAACDFRAPLFNDVALGTISSTQTGNVVASITLRYQCTRGDQPAFSLTGVNDTGPGLHRMRNLATATAYLPYFATTTVQRTRFTVILTVTEADYRNASIGSYEDTLLVNITP